MAKALWADVHFHDEPAGILREEPGGRISFAYHADWLEANKPAIAWTLPVRPQAYRPARGLPPFFDNLTAEGWLAEAQARALRTSRDNRLALLIGFGLDLVGAVTVVDPEPDASVSLDWGEPDQVMALAARASLSGVQPKMTVVKDGNQFRPARPGEVSTHIAKLPSPAHGDLLHNEWLTLKAIQALLPKDEVARAELVSLGEPAIEALLIERFDRRQGKSGVERIHFEEFNQLLGRMSADKYDAGYEAMADFMRAERCPAAEVDRLFRRVLVCILTGNTDAHLKNFALFRDTEMLRLTPGYDLVSAALYPPYQTLALSISGASHLRIGELKAKNLSALARGFGLPDAALELAVKDLGKTLPKALEVVEAAPVGTKKLRTKLMEMMQKRWNGTFAGL